MQEKKDIVFLCQFFHPEYISSAQLPFDTAKALAKAGYRVEVVCGYPKEYYQGPPVPMEETLEGVTIHRLRYLQPDRSKKLGRLVNYFSFTLAAFAHLGRLRNYRTVVVYSNPPILPWVAAQAKKRYGCKLVFVSYDLYPELALRTNALRPGSLIFRAMSHINEVVYPLADRVVALSGEMQNFIRKNRAVMPENVWVIPNWYSDHGQPNRDLTDNRFAKELGDKFVVSYFGNMGTIQDMQTILDTLREMRDEKDVFFLFAGHGNKEAALRETIAKEHLQNARVLDYLHGKDYQDALQISSAALISLEAGTTGLCVPSKTYSYMMQGIPLIAIMDECDIVKDIRLGAGLSLHNGESARLAQMIRALRDDPEALKAMRETCRKLYLEKYTPEICTEKYVTMFRSLLGSAEKEQQE